MFQYICAVEKKTTFQVHFQNRNRFVRKRSLFIICIAVHYVHCALAMYSAKYNIVESSKIMFLNIVQWFTFEHLFPSRQMLLK